MSMQSAGAKFRQAMKEESPLQVIGAINANHALLAKRAGFKAIYLSGGGVAAGSLGLPDLGISNLDDVLTVCRLKALSDCQEQNLLEVTSFVEGTLLVSTHEKRSVGLHLITGEFG